jgi:hypothetical protein
MKAGKESKQMTEGSKDRGGGREENVVVVRNTKKGTTQFTKENEKKESKKKKMKKRESKNKKWKNEKIEFRKKAWGIVDACSYPLYCCVPPPPR